ncbi:uncharacterized protein LOC116612330 [Nematostella vectensis]|uniref:uncharacterized protein LOC116612330 n=1 Tax=Nematostella vectensis TaxID=45351 RepID=UPI00138FFC0F|nr:uncharacterized protein LOC116612330 [Nematostella vectensis]
MSESTGNTLKRTRANLDLERIIRKIMLRRLLSLRSKTEKAETEKNNDDAEKMNTDNSSECQTEKAPSVLKTDQGGSMTVENGSDKNINSLVMKNVIKESNSCPEIDKETDEKKDIGTEKSTSDHNREQTPEIPDNLFDEPEENFGGRKEEERLCENKEITCEDKKSEIIEKLKRVESEAESDTSPSEGARSDLDEKDSGIEKCGDSPIPPEESQEAVLVKEACVGRLDLSNTTLQVLTPVSFKPRRNIRRTNSERRPKGMTKPVDVDSEYSDSSPEKTLRSRRNMRVSYLSFPQRYVRSSLAVEARLSQWRKETIPATEGHIVTQGRGVQSRSAQGSKAGTPSSMRKGILKQGDESSAPKTRRRQSRERRALPSGFWDSSDSGLSDDETQARMRMPVRKIHSNKSALRKRIDDLEGMLAIMTQQKRDLEHVIEILRCWSADLREVERTKLGVPYIRSVKQILKKQSKSLCDQKSEFNKLVSILQDAQIPCIDDVIKFILQLRHEVGAIVHDKRRYNVQCVERVRHLQGCVTGTCTAIKDVYYEA